MHGEGIPLVQAERGEDEGLTHRVGAGRLPALDRIEPVADG